MTSQPTTGSWCPSCGDEYRADIDHCVDCLIELVDEKPTVLVPVAATNTDLELADEPLVIDFETLTEEQQAVLLEHIEVVPVPVRLVGDGLIQAEDGYENELEDALRLVLTGTSSRRTHQPVALSGEPLSMRRRSSAFVIDAGLVAAVTFAADQSLDGGSVALIAIVVSMVNQVVGLGERGRSLGKAVGGGVVRHPDGGVLPWGEATVRWMAKDGPSTVLAVLWWSFEGGRSVWLLGQLVAICFVAALVGSVLFDSQRRGLHDQLVGAAVMNAGSITRPGAVDPGAVDPGAVDRAG